MKNQNKQSVKQAITENRAEFTLAVQLDDMAELIQSIPAAKRGQFFSLFSFLLPSFLLQSLPSSACVSSRAHLTGQWETQFTNPVKN